MTIFAMPSLGADMESGTLVEWMIKPGDTVTRGDVVAVVETQKGAIEIECFEEGTVETLNAEIGATLAVGAPLATLRAPADDTASSAQPAVEAEKRAKPKAATPTPAHRAKAPRDTSAPLLAASATLVLPRAGEIPAASPAARVSAAERGIDLAARLYWRMSKLRNLPRLSKGRLGAAPSQGSTWPRCARPSPTQWPARNAKSRITT
jgi:pyruvate dehydrogenase E2 component (dihydrolipoamide acetyltransferase)